MADELVIYLLFHLLTTLAKLVRPGGGRSVIAENLLLEQRNPRYGCPRIAQQINLAFGLDLDKDTVRRVLAVHYKPDLGKRGPSWLTTIGHAKDSLCSVDLFRTESITFQLPMVA